MTPEEKALEKYPVELFEPAFCDNPLDLNKSKREFYLEGLQDRESYALEKVEEYKKRIIEFNNSLDSDITLAVRFHKVMTFINSNDK